MTNASIACPKCQGQISWVEGHPKTSVWAYTKVPLGGGVPIAAFHCKGCGYLEFYADEKFAAE